MNADRNYDGLLTAGSVVFGFGVLALIVSMIAAFYWVSLEKADTAIIAVGWGVGLLINGVIVRGLIRLAVNVANDVASSAGVKPFVKPSAAAEAEPSPAIVAATQPPDQSLQSRIRTCTFCGVQTLGDEETCARCGQPLPTRGNRKL
jgi:hypothetical protein